MLIVAYLIIITYNLHYWNSTSPPTASVDTSSHFYSIIIPSRNESHNIVNCLRSILDNKSIEGFNFEIIVVDDHSEDDSLERIKTMKDDRISTLELKDYIPPGFKNNFKKAAIDYAISESKGDYIIQLDADSVLGSTFFSTLSDIVRTDSPDLIAGPIQFSPTNKLLHHFQALDMNGMMALTNTGIRTGNWYLANGANLIYKRPEKNLAQDSLASGDDIHRIESFAEQGKRIQFAKNSALIARTSPVNTIKDFFSQRIRWATKNKFNTNLYLRLIMTISYLNAIAPFIHLVCFFTFGPTYLIIFASHILLKLSIDYIYLKSICKFFNNSSSMKYFLPSSMIHFLYLSIIGTLSLFIRKYPWKGRTVH